MTAPWSGPYGVGYQGEMHHYQEGNGVLSSSLLARAGPPAKERAPMPPWAHQARANPAPPPALSTPGTAQPWAAGGGKGGANIGVVVPPPVKAPPPNRRFPLEEYRQRLVNIYKVHKADNVLKVDYLLEKYRGEEEFLYQSVCTKYSIDSETGLDVPAFSKAKTKSTPAVPSPQEIEGFKFGDSAEGGAVDAPAPKAIYHEVEEWDPATGQTVITTVELDAALLEALPELKASMQAAASPKPKAIQPGHSISDGAMNGSPPQTQLLQQQLSSDRSVVKAQPVVQVPPNRSPAEDDDEYDPFSTEPNQAPAARNPREAIAEIDFLLVGESSSFFEAWQRQPQPVAPAIPEQMPPLFEIPSISSEAQGWQRQPQPVPPAIPEQMPPLFEIPSISTEAEVSSAPWAASRRRRRFEVEPPGTVAQSPAITQSSSSGTPTAPPVVVAAYEAALLSQTIAVGRKSSFHQAQTPMDVVELDDSDNEADLRHKPLASIPQAQTSVAPHSQVQSMDVVELDDSDNEEDLRPKPQVPVRANVEEDTGVEAYVDPYLLVASNEDTGEPIGQQEVRRSDREALVEQLVEEAEAEAEAEAEIAQERAIQAAAETSVCNNRIDEDVKMAEMVNDTCKESSSEYTSCTDSSEEDGEDKTALAALAAVSQAAVQRAQPVFQ